ncbi:VOC family protein [Kibdelosporangium philippinense]|uniref:VOC family protein n=1 Tax=Kibdelosporangium philippinense TaxID=211113 RepID=A0ABS8ZB27_9PSEU|nr:VOC family protein [Kibdelosporangium philippinense]MCE7004015.1 VOC family protein [Kibdelosporangium philippinense]
MTTEVTPYFGYRDGQAAIEFLTKAFGFETTMKFDDEKGGVAHAELRLGDAVIIVFNDYDGYERAPRKGDTSGQGVYLVVDSKQTVDRLHQQATALGAVTIWEPVQAEYNYRFRVQDPEGFEWSFGIHRPGEPQDDWS